MLRSVVFPVEAANKAGNINKRAKVINVKFWGQYMTWEEDIGLRSGDER